MTTVYDDNTIKMLPLLKLSKKLTRIKNKNK